MHWPSKIRIHQPAVLQAHLPKLKTHNVKHCNSNSDLIFRKLTRTTLKESRGNYKRTRKNVYKQAQKDSTLRIYTLLPLCSSQTCSLFWSYTKINIQNTTITLILPSYHSFTLMKACCFYKRRHYYGPSSPWYWISQDAFAEEATPSFPDPRLMLTCDLSPDSSCFCWSSVFFAVRKRPPHPLARFNACKWRDSCR